MESNKSPMPAFQWDVQWLKDLIPEHKRESWDATKKTLIVDESQREEKYRSISSLLQKCNLKEILNQKYIESYENVIFIIGGDLMWAELKARLGLDAYICTGHIYAIYLFIIILCKILFFVKKYKQIIRLQKNCTLLASGHICHIAFYDVKVSLYSYKTQNQCHLSWDLYPLNVSSDIYWIQKAWKAYFLINAKHPIKSFLRLIHYQPAG